MSAILPTTRNGWLYYLSSALIIAIALVINLDVHRKSFLYANGDEWRQDDFTFLESDFPPYLIPLSKHPWDSALVVEDTVHYEPNVSAEWASIFPAGTGGFVRLGPNSRLFGVSMFHQLHCLDKMRRAVVDVPPTEWESWHTQHCLNYVRQMLLCAANVRLEPVKEGRGPGEESLKVDGLGLEHQCRDWSILRREVERNFERWPADAYP
ncbi:hypothetical protein BD309DRAFT_900784 [Dichomitus squalens]|nr:hypothetical protein BD309DRAFT_900784 [Dichomitus squalens]